MSAPVPVLLPPDMDVELDARLERCPAHCRAGLADYLRYGMPPGHFLQAVLTNDLTEACARADEQNQRALFDYVSVLWNYAPCEAWGSADKVIAWIARGVALRAAAEVEA